MAVLAALALIFVTARSFDTQQHLEMLCGNSSVLGALRLCLLGFAALAWTGSACPQDIYKWVDRSGVTQYSATPPPPGIAATVICPMPAPSADAASQAKAEAQRMIDDANRCVAELLREQEQKRVEVETERSRIDARLRSCANARVQLFTLTFGVPVYRYNNRGERVYLEDSARDAEVARLRREVATDCSSAASMQAAQDAATRQRLVDSFRARDCSAARDYLRDVEASGSRIPSTEVEQARREATLACTDVPQTSPTDWLGLKKVVRN